MADKAEIKVDKAVVYDSKLEANVKKTAKSAAEAAAGEKFEESYVIKLVPTLKFDEKAREIVATCTWQIYEGGGTKLFARLKQTKQSTARATVKPDKITQGNLDDTVGAVADKEVNGDHEVAEDDEVRRSRPSGDGVAFGRERGRARAARRPAACRRRA